MSKKWIWNELSPKKQFFEFNHHLLYDVKLAKIFQEYCHLNFSGDISKLGYLDEETEQVMTLFWTGDHLLGYYATYKYLLIVIKKNTQLMCWMLFWVFSKLKIKTPGKRQLTSFCCVYCQQNNMRNMFKINKKNIRTTSMTSFCCLYC